MHTISLSTFDDIPAFTEKRSEDTEGAQIISCFKTINSTNPEDFIEVSLNSSSCQTADNATKATENSINANWTTEFQHIITSPTEAYSSIVNIIDNPSTNVTAYEMFAFAPSNRSYTGVISAPDSQEDLQTDVLVATDLEPVSVIALETTVPKPTTENTIVRDENTQDDIQPLKNHDANRPIDSENISLETIVTAK